MRTEHVPACPVCSSPLRALLYRGLVDRWYALRGSWDFHRCRSCGLEYLDPRPAAEELPAAYETYYTHQKVAPGTPTATPTPQAGTYRLSSLFLRSMSRMQQRADSMYLDDVKPGRLLDVGCGDGRFLERMATAGWLVEGVEVDRCAADTARSRGFAVHNGTLQSAGYGDRVFDAVTMDHVIEHVTDPVAILGECHRVLRPGGRLVVITPNVDALGRRCFGRAWRDLDPPRHLFVASRQALALAALRAGLGGARIDTTSARAAIIFAGSLQIRRTGRYDEQQPTPRWVGRAALIFLVLETLLVSIAGRLGEELVLRADRS